MVLSRYLFFGCFCLMAIISCFLIAEFNYFYKANGDLEQLKTQYEQMISNAKAANRSESPESCANLEKIEKKGQSAVQFLTVNRKPGYLKKSALNFARRHKLEQDLKRLYLTDIRACVKKDKRGRKGLKFYRKPTRIYSTPGIEAFGSQVARDPIFIWPVKRVNCYLSSRFGPRKKPNGSWEFHTGLDLAACRGEPVKAAGSGRVIEAQFAPGYGNTVVIEHGAKFKTRYAHLDKILAKRGQDILQGEIIGKVGSTGCVRASKRGGDPSHLHFEVYVNGKQVNPLYYLKG